MKEQLLQTDDITGQTARVLSYELLSSAAKLITNYKTQVNLAVYTYDGTLLNEFLSLYHKSLVISMPEKNRREVVGLCKLIKFDLKNGDIYF